MSRDTRQFLLLSLWLAAPPRLRVRGRGHFSKGQRAALAAIVLEGMAVARDRQAPSSPGHSSETPLRGPLSGFARLQVLFWWEPLGRLAGLAPQPPSFRAASQLPSLSWDLRDVGTLLSTFSSSWFPLVTTISTHLGAFPFQSPLISTN